MAFSRWVVRISVALLLTLIGTSTSFAQEPSNKEIAQALAFSGCTGGISASAFKSETKNMMELIIFAGVVLEIIDDGTDNKAILKVDNPSIRSVADHVKQSWVTAGALDPKWKLLNEAYSQAISVGLGKWHSGSNLGVVQKAANAKSNASLTSLCRIATIGVTEKSGTSFQKIKKYVIQTTGKFLPPLPIPKDKTN